MWIRKDERQLTQNIITRNQALDKTSPKAHFPKSDISRKAHSQSNTSQNKCFSEKIPAGNNDREA